MSRPHAGKSNTSLILPLSSIEESIRAMLFSTSDTHISFFYYLIKDYSKLMSRRLQARFVFWKGSRFFTLVIEASEFIHLEIHVVIHIFFFFSYDKEPFWTESNVQLKSH